MTPTFEKALEKFMRLRGLTSKSEAVRVAVQDAAEREARARRTPAFAQLRGAALGAAVNAKPRFKSDDDLWQE